jgi:hypothetical protein
MRNLTVHLGSATPAFFSGRPTRARALPAPADRPAPPVSIPAARHCGAAPRQTPLPSLIPSATHARRMSPASAVLGPLPGVVHRSGPGPTAPPHRVAPPHPDSHLFPPLFPSAALPPSRSLPARTAPLVLPSPLLSDSSSRAPEPPHRSPHLDRHLRPPAAHSPSWIPAEHRHRLPLPGELLPELPIHAISCSLLTSLPLRCCRTPHPPSPPTGAPSPPMNDAARRRLRRLTVDPPFRCAPTLSSLPGTFPVTPSRSPATPCRH